MKLLLLLIFPILTFAQTSNQTKIYLLGKKVELTTPAQLVNMSNQMWDWKYKNRPRPALALANKNGEESLIGMITDHRASDSQISAYTDFQIVELKKVHPELQLIDKGVKTVRGKKVGYYKLQSQGTDKKILNYFFFTIIDGEIVLFNFNSIESLRADWEKKIRTNCLFTNR